MHDTGNHAIKHIKFSSLIVVFCVMSPFANFVPQISVADPGGDGGIHPPTGLKHRGLERSLYVKTANFFGALRRLLFN
jgi:hypothetical protein